MRDVAGRRLTFHLAGINNQNFLMRDQETGSYWQQISGTRHLRSAERPATHTRALRRTYVRDVESGRAGRHRTQEAPRDASEYEAKDWDVRMKRQPTVIQFPEHGMQSRDLILGIHTPTPAAHFSMTGSLRKSWS